MDNRWRFLYRIGSELRGRMWRSPSRGWNARGKRNGQGDEDTPDARAVTRSEEK